MGREASAKGAVSGKGLGITKEPRLSRSQHLHGKKTKLAVSVGKKGARNWNQPATCCFV